MGLYQYSVVRCVPEPRTGEFINVGAIAGSAEDGNWDARLITSFRRAWEALRNRTTRCRIRVHR
jgi:Protein of unknown function (DUF3037)